MLPGLDGRKMSKSYDNTVPLFDGGARGLREAIARVVTDSRAPGEPKPVEGSQLVAIHDAFASDDQRAAFHAALRGGLAWGDAKAQVVERVEHEIGPLRARYAELIAHPERVEQALLEGARKARAVAAPFLATLREAVGLRRMVAVAAPAPAAAASKVALAAFKQYREPDGRFYFKLVGADGRVLLQSRGFASGREAGQCIAALKADRAAALPDAPVARGEGVSAQDVVDALDALRAAAAAAAAAAG